MHQLIDREGRILGVINVIDALVLAVILTLTPAFYYSYRLVHQPPPPPPVAPSPPTPPTWVTVRGLMIGLPYEALTLVSPGDVEMDPTAGGGELARIVAVWPIDTLAMTRPVVIALRCVREGSRLLLYKGKPIKVGNRLVLEPDEWDGVVLVQEFRVGEVESSQLMPMATTLPEGAAQHERAVVRVTIQNLFPEVASVIHEGDYSISPTDRQELRVVEVQDVTAGTVPGMVTVQCNVEIECILSGAERFYERTPVKIGRVLRVETERYSVEGTILSVTPIASVGGVSDVGA